MTTEEKIQQIRERLPKAKYEAIKADGRIGSLTRVIVAFAQRKGQTILDNAAQLTASTLDADIERYYGRELAFEEVMLALDWGMHRVFGEFSGINVDRLFEFVRQYKECPERADALTQTKLQDARLLEPVPDKENIGLLNWNAMYDYAEKAYLEFLSTGGLPGTGAGQAGLAGALAVVQRHNEANVYRWLKNVDIVNVDADTMGTEATAIREAERRLRRMAKGRPVSDMAIKDMAYAMMLENFFWTAESQGYNFLARLAEVSETPEEERRFWS